MSVVAERVSEIHLGEPQHHLNLRLFPLLGPGVATDGVIL